MRANRVDGDSAPNNQNPAPTTLSSLPEPMQRMSGGSVLRKRLILGMTSFLLLGYLQAGVVWAQEDAYLRELESEAQEVRVDPKTDRTRPEVVPQSFTGSWGADKQNLEEGLPSGLGREAFDAALEERFYGSYIFYRDLPRQARDEVYNHYTAGAGIDELRKLIIEFRRRY